MSGEYFLDRQAPIAKGNVCVCVCLCHLRDKLVLESVLESESPGKGPLALIRTRIEVAQNLFSPI